MRLQPEAHGSYVRMFEDRFRKAVLEAVSQLPFDEKRPPPDSLIEDIAGSSELQRKGNPTYKVMPDNSVRLTFPLRGNVRRFLESLKDILGAPWESDGDAVTNSLKGERDMGANKAALQGLLGEVDRAATAFTRAHGEAKDNLRALANNAYVERGRLEQAMKEMNIQKPDNMFAAADSDWP